MTYPKPGPRFPLPVAAKAMPDALVKLHQRLQGELEKVKRGDATLVNTQDALFVLDAVETATELVRSDINTAGIKPSGHHTPCRGFHAR